MNKRSILRIGLRTVTFAALLVSVSAAHAGRKSLDGQIRIVNDRVVPIKVAIDGVPAGKVNGSESQVLVGVPNGVRLVTVSSGHGRDGNRHKHVERVSVPIDGTAKLRVRARLGMAHIRNDSGVTLRIKIDGVRTDTLRSGRHFRTEPLRPGAYTLIARPTDRGAANGVELKRKIEIRAGQVFDLRLPKWHATLAVTQSVGKRARVVLDGRPLGRVQRGERARFDGLSPGRHTLELRRRGETLAKATMYFEPGETSTWRPIAPQGEIHVTNHRRRAVTVRIDRERVTTVAPGQTERIRRVRVGSHTVTVEHANGREIAHHVDVASASVVSLDIERRARPPRPVRVAARHPQTRGWH